MARAAKTGKRGADKAGKAGGTAEKVVAKPVAFTGDIDAFLAEVWTLRDFAATVTSYQRAAKTEPAFKRTLARSELLRGEEAGRVHWAIEAEGTTALLAPLLAAEMFSDHYFGDSLYVLSDWAIDARAVPVLREVLARTKDADVKLGIWATIAAAGTEEDRAEARTHNRKLSRLTTVLASRGDADAQRMFVAELEAWLEKWPKVRHLGSSEFEDIFRILEIIGEHRIAAAVPALVRAVETPLAMRALVALAEIGDAGGADAARRILDDVRGPDSIRQWSYALPAQWLLAELGETVDPAMAREACRGVRPQRYGFPKKDEVALIEACAGEVLVRCGTDADRELLARWATRRDWWHRKIGTRALASLGRPVPARQYWDSVRIAAASVEELRAALADPLTVYREEVAAALGAKHDASAIAWAVDQLESVENFWVDVSDADDDEVDPVSAVALEVVRNNKKAPRVVASKSAWIQSLLSEQAMPYPAGEAGGAPMRATRLDVAPFVFGQQINGMAIDPAGMRLAVVGKELGQIVDARTGEVTARLDLRYSWGYDCAFSPDGRLLAVAYHGCHLLVFDAATGVEQRELAWPGGVPNGVKKCAWSPDGTLLAAGGSDGQAFVYAWPSGKVCASVKATKRGQGFEAVRWSADGRRCTFSEVSPNTRGTNALHVLDIEARKTKRIPMPMSVWALLELPDGRTIAGGETKTLVLDAKLAPTSTRLAQQGVVRLAPTADGFYALGQSGTLLRWTTTGKKPTSRAIIEEGSGAMWAMAVGGDGSIYIGGSEGLVVRFDARGTLIEREGHVHTDQARGFAALADGSVITSGWDGRVLRWPPTFRTASLVATHDGRAPEVCGRPDRAAAYVGVPAGVLVVSADGSTRSIKLKKDEDVEALACDGELLVVATEKDRVVAFATRDLAEAWSVKLHEPSAVCFRSDGLIMVGTEDGELVALGRAGTIEWRRHEHKDLSDKLPHGNPHRRVCGLAANGEHWACASNDDSLRLFAGDRRARRFLADSGLFNGVAFSPSGHRMASTGSHALQVIDVRCGELVATVPLKQFAGADSLTRPYFLDDTRLVVGAENGSIFEIAPA